MSHPRITFRLLTAFTVAIVIGSTMTACSKDSNKGTPVSDRGASAGPLDAAAAEAGDRGADVDTTGKATPKAPTNMDQRGADNRATGVQVNDQGIPAGAFNEQGDPTGDTSFDSLKTTPASMLGVSSNNSLVDESLNVGGDYSFRSIIGTEMASLYQWLNVYVPDYSQVHVRANHREYPPITTLGTDPRGEFDFTDYNDDILLNTALQHSLRQGQELENEQFVEDSKDFAGDIKDIRAQVTPYHAGGSSYSIATAKVTYNFEGTNRTLDLYGIINKNFQATMGQKLAVGAAPPEHQFQGYLTCLDQAGASYGCQNSILVIEQVKNGKICKRVFAVVRHTNVAMTIARDEYHKYYTEPNQRKRAFLQYIGNTILGDRIDDKIIVPADGDEVHLFGDGAGGVLQNRFGEAVAKMPMPYMQSITTRTFAVAHGYAETEMLLQESSYKELKAHQMRRPELRDHRKDILRVVGPLAKPRPGHNVSAFVEVDGYIQDEVEAWVRPWSNEPLLSQLISSAEIVGNDGRGFVEVKFNFDGASLLVNFTGDNVPVKDPRSIKLYPYQGHVGPSNINADMMPVPL